jgi:hypothetical protein
MSEGGEALPRLEYRLLDEEKGYPVLYYYDGIDKEEISLRFACDYFVKDQHVYEKTSCAVEDGTYVIYIRRAEDEKVLDDQLVFAPDWRGIRLEVRHFREGTAHYPVVHTFYFHSDEDALLHLQSDLFYIGGREWQKTSAEVDENRKVYVIYAEPTEEGG